MRIHRLISILLLIESRGKIKAKELASKLEISVRTIYRDIDILNEAGIPITTTTGPNGGINFIEGFSVNINKLQEGDIMNLYLASLGIKPDIYSDFGVKLQNSLLKLEKNVDFKYSNNFEKARNRFYFDNNPWWGEHTKVLYIDVLVNSVLQSFKLIINYAANENNKTTRVIHPYGIVVKRSDWYIVAYCEKRKDIRTFKCERIIKAEKLQEKFSIPLQFNLSDYWNTIEQSFKRACLETKTYLAKIKICKEKSYILKELEITKLKEENDYIIATVNMYEYESACCDIMNIIGNVEVLKPNELRDFVKTRLKHIIKMYWYCLMYVCENNILSFLKY